MENETPEEIAQHYSACLDSVAVINNPDSDEDMSPIAAAIAA